MSLPEGKTQNTGTCLLEEKRLLEGVRLREIVSLLKEKTLLDGMRIPKVV